MAISKNAGETEQQNLTKNSILEFFYVASLFFYVASIPHELELKAIEYWLDKYSKLIYSRLNKHLILEALKIVLKNNHFLFN